MPNTFLNNKNIVLLIFLFKLICFIFFENNDQLKKMLNYRDNIVIWV